MSARGLGLVLEPGRRIDLDLVERRLVASDALASVSGSNLPIFSM